MLGGGVADLRRVGWIAGLLGWGTGGLGLGLGFAVVLGHKEWVESGVLEGKEGRGGGVRCVSGTVIERSLATGRTRVRS